MSFDLYFCWQKNKRINFADVKSWASSIEYFTIKDTQLWYANSKTGVYFSIDFVESSESPEGAPPMPFGYFDSGLSFNLNYTRPSYFAFEAMPFVGDLAARFGLSVIDPQAEFDGPQITGIEVVGALTRSWIDHNRRATIALIQDPDFSNPLRMPATDSQYLWRYIMAKQDLEKVFGDSVFVPNLVPLQKKGDRKVGRAITYTQGIPMIVPQCEWVLVARKWKRLFRSEKVEVVAISGLTFRELLVGCIKPFEWRDPELEIIGPEFSTKAGHIIGTIEKYFLRSDFEVIGTDSFVDIELPQSD